MEGQLSTFITLFASIENTYSLGCCVVYTTLSIPLERIRVVPTLINFKGKQYKLQEFKANKVTNIQSWTQLYIATHKIEN